MSSARTEEASPELRRLLQESEELLWRTTPKRGRLLVDGFGALLPVLFVLWMFGVFVTFVAGLVVEANGGDPLSILPAVGAVASVVVLVAAGGAFWVAKRRYDNAEYAVTDRRLVSFSGAFGRDASSVEFDSIRDLEVSVGGIDSIFDTGTIHVATEGSGDLTFRYVERPHDLAAELDAVRSGDATGIDTFETPATTANSTPASSADAQTEAETGWEFGETNWSTSSQTERHVGPGAEDVSETLLGLLRGGETLQWHYRPSKRLYFRQTMLSALLAGLLVVSIFYALFVVLPVLSDFGPLVESFFGVSATVAIAAGWVTVQTLWLVVMALAAWSVHDRLEFAATDQRVIKVGGFVGVDTSAAEWADVTDLEIKRNLMTRVFDTGNILVSTGGTARVRFGPVLEPLTHLNRLEAIRRGEAEETPILVAGETPSGISDTPAGTASVDSLSSHARRMLRDGETLVWRGTPSLVPFLVPSLLGGATLATLGTLAVPVLGLFGGVLAFVGIASAGKRALAYRNSEYVVTDQRVMSFGGAFGRDASSVEWSDVRNVETNVGPLDGPFDTGTLRFGRAGGSTAAERADTGNGNDAFPGVTFERVPDARRVAERIERGRRPDER